MKQKNLLSFCLFILIAAFPALGSLAASAAPGNSVASFSPVSPTAPTALGNSVAEQSPLPPAARTAENDTLLSVLREALVADFSELQQQDVKPYFMSFRVLETHRTNIASTFGFLANSNQ